MKAENTACNATAWNGRAFHGVGEHADALAAFFCLAAFAFVYSLSLAPNFAWHLRSSAARLLWAPSLFVLAEALRWRRRGVRTLPRAAEELRSQTQALRRGAGCD